MKKIFTILAMAIITGCSGNGITGADPETNHGCHTRQLTYGEFLKEFGIEHKDDFDRATCAYGWHEETKYCERLDFDALYEIEECN